MLIIITILLAIIAATLLFGRETILRLIGFILSIGIVILSIGIVIAVLGGVAFGFYLLWTRTDAPVVVEGVFLLCVLVCVLAISIKAIDRYVIERVERWPISRSLGIWWRQSPYAFALRLAISIAVPLGFFILLAGVWGVS
jgi:hypothetical protein